MVIKWNEWQRNEITTRCSDPTVVVTWSYRWKLGSTTQVLEVEEFQGIYTLSNNGHRVGTHLEVPGIKEFFDSFENSYQDELNAQAQAEDDLCEHGYRMDGIGNSCRGCDPDGN